jgi:hypothetical protein
MNTEEFLKNKKCDQDITELSNFLKNKYDLKKLYLSENLNEVSINNIIVNNKNNGIGSAIIQEIIDYADKNNKKVLLNAEVNKAEGTTSKNRLIKFYKRFSFVENKGRNIMYEVNYSMYRLPLKKPTTKVKCSI